MPRGHEHNQVYSLIIYARFSGQFFFKFSWRKIIMRKKDRCAVFGFNNDRLFPETNLQWSSLFARKARVNTERVPPGHPLIPLKPNKFNMAAVSVKWSIGEHNTNLAQVSVGRSTQTVAQTTSSSICWLTKDKQIHQSNL